MVAIFSDLLRRGEAPTVFGDGLQTRDYIYVSDVAQRLRAGRRGGAGGHVQRRSRQRELGARSAGGTAEPRAGRRRAISSRRCAPGELTAQRARLRRGCAARWDGSRGSTCARVSTATYRFYAGARAGRRGWLSVGRGAGGAPLEGGLVAARPRARGVARDRVLLALARPARRRSRAARLADARLEPGLHRLLGQRRSTSRTRSCRCGATRSGRSATRCSCACCTGSAPHLILVIDRPARCSDCLAAAAPLPRGPPLWGSTLARARARRGHRARRATSCSSSTPR